MAETTLARIGRMWLTFLGTAGVGGPSRTRSGAATSLSFETSNGLQNWLVNCGEGTRRQLFRTHHPFIKSKNVRKVFVSQVNMDHCMGIMPLMDTILNDRFAVKSQNELLLEFYGPSGLRQFIRDSLRLNRMRVRGRYAVHELQRAFSWENIIRSMPNKAPIEISKERDEHPHPNEILGKNILCKSMDRELWLNIVPDSQQIRVDAGWSSVSAGGLGFVFTERDVPADHTPRKVAVLGSTEYTSAMKEISMDATVMVHGVRHALISLKAEDIERQYAPLGKQAERLSEDAPTATNANISESPSQNAIDVDSVVTDSNDLRDLQASDTRVPDLQAPDSSAEMTIPSISSFGSLMHSEKMPNMPRSVTRPLHTRANVTPGIVGEFARSARAQQLYLNHFVSRFQQPSWDRRSVLDNSRVSPYGLIMSEIERQATNTFGGPWAVAAHDMLVVPILPVESSAPVGTPENTEKAL
ncbi:hypothetical protein M0805_007188 [Coniferiporia weirii]|nr:hypothetical protein M0805_007188 [Coniferiporia weirii]